MLRLFKVGFVIMVGMRHRKRASAIVPGKQPEPEMVTVLKAVCQSVIKAGSEKNGGLTAVAPASYSRPRSMQSPSASSAYRGVDHARQPCFY